MEEASLAASKDFLKSLEPHPNDACTIARIDTPLTRIEMGFSIEGAESGAECSRS